jgi:hypothetical protein
MCAILCMLLLWQTCAPLCMPRPIGLPYFTSSLHWQTCASLCMPRPISLPFFASSLLWHWQTYMPLCMLHAPSDRSADLTSSLLWQTCAPFCMPHQIGLPYFTCSFDWHSRHLHVLAADLRLFSFSQDFDTAFAAAVIAPALVIPMIQTRPDTNWKLVVAEKVCPKDVAMMILWCEYF